MGAIDGSTGNFLRAIVLPSTEERGATIAALAAKITCWEDTIAAAQDHGILPRLYAEILADPSRFPSHALELARKEFQRNAFHCIANAAELLQVLRVFDDAGIAALPFKGVVLGASLYGDLSARAAGDLDVLIHYRDLLAATGLLQDRGFKLLSHTRADGTPLIPDLYEYHFERAADGMVMELRWKLDLFWFRYTYELGMDWAWPRRKMVKLAGADVATFGAISGLLMLCMHGTKHMWSRLIWISDVAKHLQSEPTLDWKLVRQEARRAGVSHCLALGVLMAHRVAGAEVPREVLAIFEADRAARRYADFLQKHCVEEPEKLPDGFIPYNIQLLAFRDKARAIFSPSFLRPNQHDRAVVKLPRALAPLYYLIRPFRILLDRTGR